MHLTRQHQVWTFRRRVPRDLQAGFGKREIYRSLATSCRREAHRRAALLFVATEELFDLVRKQGLAPEEIAAIARHWLNTDHHSPKAQIDRLPPGELATYTAPNPLPKYRPHMYPMRPDQHRARKAQLEHTFLSGVLWSAGYAATPESEEAIRPALKQVVEEYIEARRGAVFGSGQEESAPSAPTTPQRARSPMFSENVEAYLADKSRSTSDHRGYTPGTQGQVRVAFRLFVELLGERPVREYTGADAGIFRDQLLRLPASHGKGAKLTAPEAIEQADASEAEVPRMTMKTAKKHFSALTQYWKWLKPRGHVDEVIFQGFSFPGTKSSKRKRDDWSADDLRRLFRCKEWSSAAPDSAWRWLPLIALHSGMRLEEICRLRPVQDFVNPHGVLCFKIQKQNAPWSKWDPKTEAGARVVPVHRFLLELGLADLIARRRAEGASRLFPELSPGGPDGKLGFDFSRDFSRLKISLGIGPKTVFHSFRHSFRTGVASSKVKEVWIDGVMGHEGEGKSEGRIYTKRFEIQRLNEVVQSFRNQLDLSFLIRPARESRRMNFRGAAA